MACCAAAAATEPNDWTMRAYGSMATNKSGSKLHNERKVRKVRKVRKEFKIQ